MPEKAADDAAKMGGTTLGCVPVKDVLSRGRFCFRYKEVGKMPIKIQHDLPAREILNQENIFVMDETRAIHQHSTDQNCNREPDAFEGGY